LVAGVDEVGRGALAGPLTVAAVILDLRHPVAGLADSKQLTPRRRAVLAGQIKETAVAWAVARREAWEVDRLGIVAATRAAMTEAVCRLEPAPAYVMVDAVELRGLEMPYGAETKADTRYRCVAAASILAKVDRDSFMIDLATQYPLYGWDRNKGYPTRSHLEALAAHGPSSQHRKSFAPCVC
jgi:ribonuclease HII